jgi:hypothetical protein
MPLKRSNPIVPPNKKYNQPGQFKGTPNSSYSKEAKDLKNDKLNKGRSVGPNR